MRQRFASSARLARHHPPAPFRTPADRIPLRAGPGVRYRHNERPQRCCVDVQEFHVLRLAATSRNDNSRSRSRPRDSPLLTAGRQLPGSSGTAYVTVRHRSWAECDLRRTFRCYSTATYGISISAATADPIRLTGSFTGNASASADPPIDTEMLPRGTTAGHGGQSLGDWRLTPMRGNASTGGLHDDLVNRRERWRWTSDSRWPWTAQLQGRKAIWDSRTHVLRWGTLRPAHAPMVWLAIRPRKAPSNDADLPGMEVAPSIPEHARRARERQWGYSGVRRSTANPDGIAGTVRAAPAPPSPRHRGLRFGLAISGRTGCGGNAPQPAGFQAGRRRESLPRSFLAGGIPLSLQRTGFPCPSSVPCPDPSVRPPRRRTGHARAIPGGHDRYPASRPGRRTKRRDELLDKAIAAFRQDAGRASPGWSASGSSSPARSSSRARTGWRGGISSWCWPASRPPGWRSTSTGSSTRCARASAGA